MTRFFFVFFRISWNITNHTKSKTESEKGVFPCVPFWLRSLGAFERCALLQSDVFTQFPPECIHQISRIMAHSCNNNGSSIYFGNRCWVLTIGPGMFFNNILITRANIKYYGHLAFFAFLTNSLHSENLKYTKPVMIVVWKR